MEIFIINSTINIMEMLEISVIKTQQVNEVFPGFLKSYIFIEENARAM